MIFVTVGTHEQPFDRLIQIMDQLKEKNLIEDEVVAQIGYGTYIPRFCRWKKMFSAQEMQQLEGEARILVSHGGPSGFMGWVEQGKVPIVMPRQKKYGEHINDHQLLFVQKLSEIGTGILPVMDERTLKEAILQYDFLAQKKLQNGSGKKGMEQSRKEFCERFQAQLEQLF